MNEKLTNLTIPYIIFEHLIYLHKFGMSLSVDNESTRKLIKNKVLLFIL